MERYANPLDRVFNLRIFRISGLTKGLFAWYPRCLLVVNQQKHLAAHPHGGVFRCYCLRSSMMMTRPDLRMVIWRRLHRCEHYRVGSML